MVMSVILTDLNPDEFHYYPFIISMNKCNGSFNAVKDPFGSICFPVKTEGVNPKVFNVIKEIKESRTLTKCISCECRCEFDGRK